MRSWGESPQLLEEVTMKIASFNSERGVTLIEVMIALIIIAIIILGGGMFFFYGRVNIIREAHRRAAVLVASQRLEVLKAADYPEITPVLFDPLYAPYYIVSGSTSWEFSQDPSSYDDVTVDNLANQKMFTQARYIDDDDALDSYDYLEVTVTVEWSDSTTNTVSLTTLIAP